MKNTSAQQLLDLVRVDFGKEYIGLILDKIQQNEDCIDALVQVLASQPGPPGPMVRSDIFLIILIIYYPNFSTFSL